AAAAVAASGAGAHRRTDRLRAVPAGLGPRSGAERARADNQNRAGAAAARQRRIRRLRGLRTAAERILGRLGQTAALDGRHARSNSFDRTHVARDAAAGLGRRDAGSAFGVAAVARGPDAAVGTGRAADRVPSADRAGHRWIGRRIDAHGAALGPAEAGAGPMESGGAGFQRYRGRPAEDLAGQYDLDRGLSARGAAHAGLS